MSDEKCGEAPVRDNVRAALELMAQGARMVLSDIPGDSSMMSMSCSGKVSKGVAAALAEAQAEIVRLREAMGIARGYVVRSIDEWGVDDEASAAMRVDLQNIDAALSAGNEDA